MPSSHLAPRPVARASSRSPTRKQGGTAGGGMGDHPGISGAGFVRGPPPPIGRRRSPPRSAQPRRCSVDPMAGVGGAGGGADPGAERAATDTLIMQAAAARRRRSTLHRDPASAPCPALPDMGAASSCPVIRLGNDADPGAPPGWGLPTGTLPRRGGSAARRRSSGFLAPPVPPRPCLSAQPRPRPRRRSPGRPRRRSNGEVPHTDAELRRQSLRSGAASLLQFDQSVAARVPHGARPLSAGGAVGSRAGSPGGAAGNHCGLRHFGPPGEVVPGLWVGSMEHANPASVARSGFDVVISLIRYSAFGGPPAYPAGVEVHNFPFVDNGRDPIPFRRISAVIDDVLHRRRRVLLHCKQGISRSVSAAIAFLIIHRAMSYPRALDVVREARPHAAPKFTDALRLLAAEEGAAEEGAA